MKLYIIHVGYYDYEVGMYELHSQFLIPATNAKEAKAKVLSKQIFIAKKMHIDGIQEINSIDGYQVSLTPSSEIEENRIFSYNEIKAM